MMSTSYLLDSSILVLRNLLIRLPDAPPSHPYVDGMSVPLLLGCCCPEYARFSALVQSRNFMNSGSYNCVGTATLSGGDVFI